MLKKIIISLLISLFFIRQAFAVYYVSETYIPNEIEAQTQCVLTCDFYRSNWTGSWWSTSDDTSVCECMRDWPYCPVIIEPPPVRPCVVETGTATSP